VRPIDDFQTRVSMGYEEAAAAFMGGDFRISAHEK
jgi:hypothetical protein